MSHKSIVSIGSVVLGSSQVMHFCSQPHLLEGTVLPLRTILVNSEAVPSLEGTPRKMTDKGWEGIA